MTLRPLSTAASAAVVALILTACASGDTVTEPTSTPSPSASRFQTTTPGPVGPTGTPAEVPDARWAAIEDDLATRGVGGAVELVSAEQVTFADGSLGCAEPGQSYTMAQVDGMRVVVTAGGAQYDYRFGTGDTPRLCPR